MKLTKSYIKKIIKEELNILENQQQLPQIVVQAYKQAGVEPGQNIGYNVSGNLVIFSDDQNSRGITSSNKWIGHQVKDKKELEMVLNSLESSGIRPRRVPLEHPTDPMSGELDDPDLPY